MEHCCVSRFQSRLCGEVESSGGGRRCSSEVVLLPVLALDHLRAQIAFVAFFFRAKVRDQNLDSSIVNSDVLMTLQ